MKEYPIKIMNICELIKFNKYCRKNHIKGKVIQNNFSANASSFWGIVFGLPLDSAKLIIDKEDTYAITEFINAFPHA